MTEREQVGQEWQRLPPQLHAAPSDIALCGQERKYKCHVIAGAAYHDASIAPFTRPVAASAQFWDAHGHEYEHEHELELEHPNSHSQHFVLLLTMSLYFVYSHRCIAHCTLLLLRTVLLYLYLSTLIHVLFEFFFGCMLGDILYTVVY